MKTVKMWPVIRSNADGVVALFKWKDNAKSWQENLCPTSARVGSPIEIQLPDPPKTKEELAVEIADKVDTLYETTDGLLYTRTSTEIGKLRVAYRAAKQREAKP